LASYYNLQSVAVQTEQSGRPELREYASVWKVVGIGERVLALVLLLLLLPCLLLAGLAVSLLSRRAPFVAHARVGQGGKRIWVLKLRTMWGPEARRRNGRGFLIERLQGEPVPEIKRSNDPRVTSAFAAVCRKFSIDELPQLWHVVMGDLALVGPRPMTVEELSEHYGGTVVEVLQVRPGLTGLWQVKGRSCLNYRQRRRFDLFLVRKRSLRLYAAILLATLPRVLTGKDAW
jgi:lipopolysaccharide/colanic/teichoic acid biosynthesis glycosyltransferase